MSQPSDRRLLLPLIGIAAALALWLLSEPIEQQARELEQQLASEIRPLRSTAGLLEQAERDAAAASRQRRQVEAALQSSEPVELLQTRFLFQLRQRCEAAGVQSCVVRFSSDVARPGAASASQPAGIAQGLASASVAEVGLTDLGLAKARAVVTGTFQRDELTALVDGLARDPQRTWRVNGLVVRSNTFELDVEQIVRPPERALRAAAAGS